tara:strand:+ start:1550 stop:1948 length:399 start_codon:yes stop_codon:yes gene_type:complete
MVSLIGIASGKIVNLVPDTPLLSKIDHVEVLATGGYKIAKSYTDVDAKHAEIYSSLETSDVPNDVRAYTYIIIAGRDGRPEAYADAWLKSVNEISKLEAKFTLALDNTDELNEVRRALQSRGYNPEIEIITK